MPPIKWNVTKSAEDQITTLFDPHVIGNVNDSIIKVAKFGETFNWHSHEHEDEAFLVLSGRIAIDFRDGTVELEQGELIIVPRTIEHRPRSLTKEPIVLLFEPSTTINTGDDVTEHTVIKLKNLKP